MFGLFGRVYRCIFKKFYTPNVTIEEIDFSSVVPNTSKSESLIPSSNMEKFKEECKK